MNAVSGCCEETEAFGEALAGRLQAGDLVLLEGDLASGKTTFVRGLVRGLNGTAEEVSSPTFVIVQSYPCDRGMIRVVHHVDLYRVAESLADLREIGLEELLSDPDAVVAVEWPKDLLVDWLPADARCWRVALEARVDETREITIIEGDD